MELGNFSISLAVKDIDASLGFYTKLGFEVLDGKKAEGWLILQNGKAVIGLFQGMFESNIMTFTPADVRSIQKSLEADGVALIEKADLGSEGPAHITLADPDGNAILMDQWAEDYEADPQT